MAISYEFDVETNIKICGVVNPGYPDITCALHAGHGRVKEPGEVGWFDHADPARGGPGAWWYDRGYAAGVDLIGDSHPVYVDENDAEVTLVDSMSDVSIARQDGQPFGANYLVYVSDNGAVGYVAEPYPVVDLAKLAVGAKLAVEAFVSGTEVETWYGLFNDPATLLPKFESGEIHAGLRETLLDTPIFESRNLGDVLRHAQLTWEDRQTQHRHKLREAESELLAPTRVVDGKLVRITPEVPPPVPVVIKTQTVTRTDWAVVPPDVLKKAVGGPTVREVSI